ncbi:MAG TPA: hypothetical protein VFR94_13785 [Nitrososphaeraceae archaeon]|nr:hypothetical protein [Nitrososphaeraceae archaeon]
MTSYNPSREKWQMEAEAVTPTKISPTPPGIAMAGAKSQYYVQF